MNAMMKNRKKKTKGRLSAALIAGMLLLSILPGSAFAAAAPAAPEPEAGTLTVTDDLGRSVEVPRNPRRVAALIGSFADIWLLADGPETLAATASDAWTSFDIPLMEDTVNLGSAKDFSLEALILSDPDLILASTNTAVNLDHLEIFEDWGVPTLYFNVESFDDYLRMLEICTAISGRPERYRQYGEAVADQVEKAVARQDGSAPSVLYIRASGTGGKVKGSTGNVLGEMLAELGCVNIADDNQTLLENLSLEAILTADPDYIFLLYQAADPSEAERVLQESLLQNPAWASLTAVREGRCYVMEHRLYNLKPNAQWGTAYERLAEILYG